MVSPSPGGLSNHELLRRVVAFTGANGNVKAWKSRPARFI
jgi:hypothetical protein